MPAAASASSRPKARSQSGKPEGSRSSGKAVANKAGTPKPVPAHLNGSQAKRLPKEKDAVSKHTTRDPEKVNNDSSQISENDDPKVSFLEPFMAPFYRRTRNLSKKLSKVQRAEEAVAQGRSINPEQKELLQQKPKLVLLQSEIAAIQSGVMEAAENAFAVLQEAQARGDKQLQSVVKVVSPCSSDASSKAALSPAEEEGDMNSELASHAGVAGGASVAGECLESVQLQEEEDADMEAIIEEGENVGKDEDSWSQQVLPASSASVAVQSVVGENEPLAEEIQEMPDLRAEQREADATPRDLHLAALRILKLNMLASVGVLTQPVPADTKTSNSKHRKGRGKASEKIDTVFVHPNSRRAISIRPQHPLHVIHAASQVILRNSKPAELPELASGDDIICELENGSNKPFPFVQSLGGLEQRVTYADLRKAALEVSDDIVNALAEESGNLSSPGKVAAGKSPADPVSKTSAAVVREAPTLDQPIPSSQSVDEDDSKGKRRRKPRGKGKKDKQQSIDPSEHAQSAADVLVEDNLKHVTSQDASDKPMPSIIPSGNGKQNDGVVGSTSIGSLLPSMPVSQVHTTPLVMDSSVIEQMIREGVEKVEREKKAKEAEDARIEAAEKAVREEAEAEQELIRVELERQREREAEEERLRLEVAEEERQRREQQEAEAAAAAEAALRAAQEAEQARAEAEAKAAKEEAARLAEEAAAGIQDTPFMTEFVAPSFNDMYHAHGHLAAHASNPQNGMVAQPPPTAAPPPGSMAMHHPMPGQMMPHMLPGMPHPPPHPHMMQMQGGEMMSQNAPIPFGMVHAPPFFGMGMAPMPPAASSADVSPFGPLDGLPVQNPKEEETNSNDQTEKDMYVDGTGASNAAQPQLSQHSQANQEYGQRLQAEQLYGQVSFGLPE